jgi:choline-sulfatase
MPNVLFIISDQHQQKVTGCYGHDFIQTPNIDGLAVGGTRFTTAYTNSPICVPARAALATGRYVHDTGYWDNSHAYDGRVKSWHQMAREHGANAVSIGKLHFQQDCDPAGFDEQIIPMHMVGVFGDVRECVKRPLAPPLKRSRTAEQIGSGETDYTKYDTDVMTKTCEWLRDKGTSKTDKPWVLMSSFVCPHPPHIAPQEFYDLYDGIDIPIPKLSDISVSLHPWIQLQQRSRNHEDFLTPEKKQVLLKAYYGCTTFLDHNIGKVLQALDDSGLRDDTIIIYTTDHGENLGARRLWGKSNMYEEACALPMIISGPDIPEGRVSTTPVTLIDIAPTILDAIDQNGVAAKEGLPGTSLIQISNKVSNPDRIAFSEYFAAAADRATFMIRKGNYKYIHYEGYEPELFDLEEDQEEMKNLACDPDYQSVLAEYQNDLRKIVDPAGADERAYRAQEALLNEFGGREKAIAKGAVQGTPPPGVEAKYLA